MKNWIKEYKIILLTILIATGISTTINICYLVSKEQKVPMEVPEEIQKIKVKILNDFSVVIEYEDRWYSYTPIHHPEWKELKRSE